MSLPRNTPAASSLSGSGSLDISSIRALSRLLGAGVSNCLIADLTAFFQTTAVTPTPVATSPSSATAFHFS